ncbi:hypothetical protein [Actinomarinicola tropica]|uniref:Zinc-finger domain-containing protein n=1 Tax=Actinomarinicola tropica TaxID=2789776 RepID=A0A5Q2RAD6_9ACTN|nr:hypothetical protein [Actinomarinicola tropica]QGG93839.1 hypothetical protein GH723_01225 [Actinomarinicola tropica]
MRCEAVADDLAGVADGSAILDQRERRHVEQCLRCQADLVHHRRILRAMRAMRTEVLEPSPGLLPEVLALIEHAGERQAIRVLLSGRRVAYIGGLAAAATAAGAGALVLASRHRRAS